MMLCAHCSGANPLTSTCSFSQLSVRALLSCDRAPIWGSQGVALAGMGGGHHDVPVGPEPPHAKFLANKSALCPPDFHYRRETWYPHGGFYCDPKGWRRNTAFAMAGVCFMMYSVFEWAKTNEVRYRAPKIWIPSLLWNDKVPDPVDFRGRILDRVTGLPKDGAAH